MCVCVCVCVCVSVCVDYWFNINDKMTTVTVGQVEGLYILTLHAVVQVHTNFVLYYCLANFVCFRRSGIGHALDITAGILTVVEPDSLTMHCQTPVAVQLFLTVVIKIH